MKKRLLHTCYLISTIIFIASYTLNSYAADEEEKSQISPNSSLQIINGIVEAVATAGSYNARTLPLRLMWLATSALLMEEHINGNTSEIKIAPNAFSIKTSLPDLYSNKTINLPLLTGSVIYQNPKITSPIRISFYNEEDRKLPKSYTIEEDVMHQLFKKKDLTKRLSNPT